MQAFSGTQLVKIATPSIKVNAMPAQAKNALVKRLLGALMISLSAWGT